MEQKGSTFTLAQAWSLPSLFLHYRIHVSSNEATVSHTFVYRHTQLLWLKKVTYYTHFVEGSTTVLTLSCGWRNSVSRWSMQNTALSLAEKTHNLGIQTGHAQKREVSTRSQSRRRILPGSSNHGMSPDNSVKVYFSDPSWANITQGGMRNPSCRSSKFLTMTVQWPATRLFCMSYSITPNP